MAKCVSTHHQEAGGRHATLVQSTEGEMLAVTKKYLYCFLIRPKLSWLCGAVPHQPFKSQV